MKLLKLIKEIEDQGKTLYAFDLDDTLIKSSSKVIVKTPDGIKKLTPAQYALFQPSPTDELDFSEFSQIKDPSLIKHNVDIFLDALRLSSSKFKTIILTARTPEVTKDIQALLKFENLPKVQVHAVGSSDPQEKAKVIQNYINQGYINVVFYDDAKPNVDAVKGLKNLKVNKDKNVSIRAVHIVHALDEAGKGLWHNIRAKRARGEKSSHPNSKAFKSAVKAGKEILKKDEYIEEGQHDPVEPGILKKRLGKLSCTKVRQERAKLKDKGTHYAKALQRYLNYHCQD
jgi:hypothetical protein